MSEPKRITISDAANHVDQTVEIPGWLYNLRKSGKIVFPILRDGTGLMQCVAVKSALPEEVFESLKHLTQESSLIIRGKIRAEPRAPGGYEMDVESADILQKVSEADPYPITPKDHGVEFLMDHRHLWLRSQRQHAIIRVRHEIIRAVRDYFDNHGFTLVDTPIFTPAACEGTTTLFEVNYFDDEKAYLSQSGQLYSEATAMAFGKVYCFGPTFRAEKSKTRRHLTEFWMVEPEMAFADLEEVKRVAEEMVVYIVERVLENRREELKVLERDTSKLEAVKAPFVRLSYDDAVKNLPGHGSEIQWGSDLGGGDETILTPAIRTPHHGRSVSLHGDQSFLHAAGSRTPRSSDGRRCSRARRLRRNHRRRPAHPRSRTAPAPLDEHKLPREAFNWYIASANTAPYRTEASAWASSAA